MNSTPTIARSPLDRARQKAFWRLLPLLFLCYVIAYVDRANVSLAKLTMAQDLPAFNDEVIGLGAGIFFLGYFLLEIPGSLIVERWGARKWICRIMLTWGVMAACTALVHTPNQFYGVRFFLGLAEAGFFPGVIVYLTHWFTVRDRARAIATFIVATPTAQIVSPQLTRLLLTIGTDERVDGVMVHHPEVLGLEGWQWVYIAWGIPAVVLGVIVFFTLTDRPREAKWLTPEECDALEQELASEKAKRAGGRKLTVLEALRHPKVLLLALAYFGCTTASYGVEFFLPSILENWHHLTLKDIAWLVMLPPVVSLSGQIFVGWNSDRTKERRLHAVIPILLGATAMGLAPFTQDHLWLTVACFMIAAGGIKAYQPAFWALPSLFLTEAAAAGSIGLINSIGNLGGYLGPRVLGYIKMQTGNFAGGVFFLAGAMMLTATVIFFLGLGHREKNA
ncbi:MAG: MFS transporter [Opitutus sp.]|nr:MFS transporter [Opitutus sp.]